MKTKPQLKVTALFLVLLIGIISPSFSQEAERLFQKGLVKEEGEGSLEEAIDIYTKVTNDQSADRSIRAKALLHVGLCYEKLGQKKATIAYEQLVTDFADQEEIAAIGRKKLTYLASSPKASKETKSDEIIIREVWSPAEDTYSASPDGRYMTYIDWKTIAICVKDLKTGKSLKVTTGGTWKDPSQFPDNSIWAPDGKQIAYYWFIGDSTELRITNLDGSATRVICKGKGQEAPWPVAWSSNGQYILAFNRLSDGSEPDKDIGQVVLVDVDDGSLKVLKSYKASEAACCGDISPDVKSVVYALHEGKDSKNNDIYLSSADGTYKGKIVSDLSNDRNALWTTDGSGIVFLSDRNGTEDLWKLNITDGKPVGEPELLKSNMGERSQLMRITEDESLIYSNMNFRVDVFTASLDFESGEILAKSKRISNPKTTFNTKPVWSPDGKYIAYLEDPESQDHELGRKCNFIIYDPETGTGSELTTDLYGGVDGKYWLQPQWAPDSKSLLVHARTDEDKLQGFFLVDIKTAARKPILVKEREPRMTNIAMGYFPRFFNNEEIIYLSVDRKEFIVRNIESGKERKVYSGEDEILHYALSPDGSQIVYGYFFEKRYALYVLRLSEGNPRKLLDSKKKDTPYVISWTPDSKYVIYELGAWGYETPHEILRVPADGGDSERVILLEDLFGKQGKVRNIEIHPDGSQIVIDMNIGQGEEIWAIENLFNK